MARRLRIRKRGWMKSGFTRVLHTAQGNYPGGKPSVLLADEPSGNLDFRTGEMIFDLLERLHRSHTLTSVLVTHNLTFARRCDRILTMEGGVLGPGTGPDNVHPRDDG